MEYKFSGVVTLKDYIQFNKMFQKKITLSMLILLGAWALFYFVVDAEKRDIYFLGLFATVLTLVIFKILVAVSYRKGYNSNKFLQDEEHFVINERFIEVTAKNSRSVAQKEKIYKVKFDKDSIYLFIAANMAYIIKKRYLKNSDEFDELKEFVKQYYM
jgi:hypothetical protein